MRSKGWKVLREKTPRNIYSNPLFRLCKLRRRRALPIILNDRQK